jgi:hypothetical protein
MRGRLSRWKGTAAMAAVIIGRPMHAPKRVGGWQAGILASERHTPTRFSPGKVDILQQALEHRDRVEAVDLSLGRQGRLGVGASDGDPIAGRVGRHRRRLVSALPWSCF